MVLIIYMAKYIIYTLEIVNLELNQNIGNYLTDKWNIRIPSDVFEGSNNYINPFFNYNNHMKIYEELKKKYDVYTINILNDDNYYSEYAFNINYHNINMFDLNNHFNQ